MNDLNEAITDQKIGIVNVLPTGTAFAVTTDGSGVYIPQAVAGAAGVKLGEQTNAKLVKNSRDPNGRTPWLAIYLEPQGGMDEAVRKSTTEDILDLLNEGYMSTTEVAEEVGIDSQSANAILNALHTEGKIVKAAVYAKPNQQRASLLLWARDLTGFMGE